MAVFQFLSVIGTRTNNTHAHVLLPVSFADFKMLSHSIHLSFEFDFLVFLMVVLYFSHSFEFMMIIDLFYSHMRQLVL